MNADAMNLLVVDDDSFQRQMVMKMLRSLGVASVCEAENGKQALEQIRETNENPVNIVICDLNMPEMDGLEFLRHLGQEQHNVAIIIVSALGNRLLLSAGKMTKMYGTKLLGVVEKPIALSHLKELLSGYEHSESRWQQPEASVYFSLEEILEGIRTEQFEPFFQPKVDLKTGRLVGSETLARWIHPKHGVVTPNAFIPQLEQSGNIDDLTFQMLKKTAAACRSYHDKGHPLSVSVNLSLTSLDDVQLAEKISRVVENAEVDPQYIVLEITETAAMTNVARALENLARLVMNGFKLSIDDYGTGYSSMQQLTRIAFGELKIDRSFVKDIADNEAQRIVVESSIDMARKLHVTSVAEGVETQQDWDILKKMGCDTAQGYYIARPMDAASFAEYCSSHA